jgi:hypothetical protein
MPVQACLFHIPGYEMIELANTFPDVNVQPAEYNRLLGYPHDWVLEGRALELAEWARDWYANHGSPWVYAYQADRLELEDDAIVIDGQRFFCRPLQKRLKQAAAHSVVLAAVSAGPEIEQEAQKLWQAERPDEYFFLEIFGSAVVEQLTTMAGAHCCVWAEDHQSAILPHYSPGYSDWDVSQQPQLLNLIQRTAVQKVARKLSVFDTGMLRPKKSQLSVFGVTRQIDGVRKLADLVACESCSLVSCQYRRAAYLETPDYSRGEVVAAVNGVASKNGRIAASLNHNGRYGFSKKALNRWAEQRLSLRSREDGTTEALFLFEGATCTSMGRPLKFQYHVHCGPKAEGYPIREQKCVPHPTDTDYTSMCEYISKGDRWIAAIEQEGPLSGQPINDVLSWNRTANVANCHCESASREQMWGIVLETIHYALVQVEKSASQEVAPPARLP